MKLIQSAAATLFYDRTAHVRADLAAAMHEAKRMVAALHTPREATSWAISRCLVQLHQALLRADSLPVLSMDVACGRAMLTALRAAQGQR